MNKNTGIAVAVFALLVVLALATRNGPPERGIERVNFSKIDTDAIDTLEIAGENPVTLVKQDGQWKVDGLAKDADSSMVERALEQLTQVNSSDMITDSSERFAEYEVDDEKGLGVVAKASGKTVAEFVVGKAANGGSHVLIEGGKVFAAKGIYKNTYSREANQWLDRRLFRGRKIDGLEKLEVSLAEGQGYTLVKKDGVWSVPDGAALPEGFRFDKNAARSIASTLVNLRARDVLTAAPAGDTGLAGAKDRYVLTFAATDDAPAGTFTLTLGGDVPVPVADGEDKAPENVYAAVDARADEVVTVLVSQAKNLRRGLDRLREMKFMDFDPAKATALSIKDAEKSLDFAKKDGAWTLVKHSEKKPEDFEFDPAMVERRVRAVSNARAASVVTDMTAASAGIGGGGTVSVTLEDGTSVALKLGQTFKDADDREQVYVAGNADDLVYAGTTWMKNNLTGGLEKFKKTQSPPPGGALSNLDPKALENLPPDVRKSLEQQIAQQQAQQRMIQQMQQQQQ